MCACYLTKEEEERSVDLQLLALTSARIGDTELLVSMIQAGMPVKLADEKGNSLLMLAAYHGHGKTVRMLLVSGAEIDRCNDHSPTPLGGVAVKGNLSLAQLLLTAGADINADNFGHRDVVEYLLDAGADPASQTWLGISA